MKEKKIEIPAGCEVEKIETQDGHVVVTFRPKLPKTWEEFCEMVLIKKGECYIGGLANIVEYESDGIPRGGEVSKNFLPDRATAEAVLALCQLIQLRNCYNQGWVPDWKDHKSKFCIKFENGDIHTAELVSFSGSPLFLKSEDLRDEFLRNFRPLIEKLKPLYGIKEGGEQ